MQGLWDILTDPDLDGTLATCVLGIPLGLVLYVAVHEAGHALFGRLGGYRIRRIRIGRGPVLFRLNLGLCLIVWHLLPDCGAVAVYRPLATARRARLLFLAGGGLANALAAAALAPLLPWPPDPIAAPVLTMVVALQAVGILNLAVVVGPGRFGTTDGGLIRRALRLPPGPDRVLARLYASEVTGRYAGLPPTPPTAISPAVLHALMVGTPAASFDDLAEGRVPGSLPEREAMRGRLLARGDLSLAERAVLLDLAVTEVLLGTPAADLAPLDGWSAALLALVPGEPSARATRGSVLVLMGRPEGRALLEADLGADPTPFEAGLRRTFLARALLDAGDRDGAAAMLTAARADLASAPDGGGLSLVAAIERELATGIAAAPRAPTAPASRRRHLGAAAGVLATGVVVVGATLGARIVAGRTPAASPQGRGPVTQPDWAALERMPLFPAIEKEAAPYRIGFVLAERRAETLARIAALSPAMRRLVWLAILEADWGRDGLHTFFFLKRGEFAPEIASALREGGLTREAAVFGRAMALFGEPYPRDHATRAKPFAWSRPGRRVDAVTTIPNDPNAFDEALFALGREFGTRAAYRRAIEAMVERDPELSAWAEARRVGLTDEDRLRWLVSRLHVAAPEAMADAVRAWPRAYRILYLLDVFNAEMLNGSVHQFFYNSSGALAPEVADALQEVGLPRHADAVRRGIALFATPYPRDTDLRRARYFRGTGRTPFDEALGDLTGAVDDGAIPTAMLDLARRDGVLPR